MFSQVMGFRLCGIEELPFWPFPKGLPGLSDFRSLQMAYFGSNLVIGRTQYCEGTNITRHADPVGVFV